MAVLQQQLKQDWARTQGDIRLNSGVPLSWLKGRSPVLSPAKFAAKWQSSGVLYALVFFFFLEQASYMSGITQPTAAPQKVRQEGHAT
jgi:hypothetical protein